MNVLTFLNSLRPSLPMSKEKPTTPTSNVEPRCWIQQGAVLINGERVEWNEEIDFPLTSVVLFPKNPQSRCTLL